MKKRVLLLITLVVSLFIYSSRVFGEQVMYMECDDGFSDYVAWITEGEGNTKLKIAYDGEEDRFPNLSDKDNCWINNAYLLDEDCDTDENGNENTFNINKKLCPEKMRIAKGFDNDVVFAGGLVQAKRVSVLKNNEYVFYKRNDGMVFAESYYSVNGIYSHINNLRFNDYYQASKIFGYKGIGTSFPNCNADYWKVAQNPEMSYVQEICNDEGNCNNYTILFDSSNNRYKLNNLVDKWINENGTSLQNDNYSGFLSLVNDNNYITAVDKMIESYKKNGKYDFKDGYSAENMYNKLKLSYEYLKEIYDNPIKYKNYSVDDSKVYLEDASESALRYILSQTIGYVKIEDYCKSNDDYECLNIPSLNAALYNDIKDYLNASYGYDGEITILDLGKISVRDDYTKKFLNAIAYFNKFSNSTDLDKEIIEKDLPELKKKIVELGEIRDIYITIDCDDLISDKLKEKISGYYNFFKILVSLILIAFGLLDFGKAIFEADENKMKESQTKFIKRILVVILLFLVPLLVKFVLTVANAVWSNIYPGACGLF